MTGRARTGSSRSVAARARSGGWLASFLVALLACWSLASAADTPSQYQVKAAFLYNFARFVDWSAQSQAQKAVTLCIIGDDPFGSDIGIITGKPVGQATLQVRRVTVEGAGACQMLFITSSEERDLDRVLASVKGRPVLTVGDTPGFAERGAVINFYLEQGKVRFEINIDAERRSGLAVSSYLLRLARITHDRSGAHG
ncbi:MAG: YfiR family protein [Caulobacteraceae bacterium]|nr:YfiR family protein [Caulobacteraceae bacterium]